MHRDLAARNILLSQVCNNCENTLMVAKISDFGLARHMNITNKEYTRANRNNYLPARNTAPEAMSSCVYNTKCEVWAFGITMWEIFSLCKSPPFPECRHDEGVYEYIMAGNVNTQPDHADKYM